jgi:hypothetical protein
LSLVVGALEVEVEVGAVEENFLLNVVLEMM